MSAEGRQMLGILSRAAHTEFVNDPLTRQSLRQSGVYEG